MATERMPRFIVAVDPQRSRYVVVLCSGQSRDGRRRCNRPLGYLNLNHPHDVLYVCRECGAEYTLRQS
jgi:hypothetical protein